jgi:hypothetical protein
MRQLLDFIGRARATTAAAALRTVVGLTAFLASLSVGACFNGEALDTGGFVTLETKDAGAAASDGRQDGSSMPVAGPVEEKCEQSPPLVIAAPSTLPAALVGKSYRADIAVRGGRPPYYYEIEKTAPALSWLWLDPTGAITGVPVAAAATAAIQIVVSDSGTGACRHTVTRDFEIRADSCTNGEMVTCFAKSSAGDACTQGISICVDGAPSACRASDQPSQELGHCGPDCGTCDAKVADRCAGGTCHCGDGPACSAGAICCAGACIDPQQDAANCGSCGQKCEAGAHAKPICSAGQCSKEVTCDPGFGRCDGSGESLACTTPLDADPRNCGSCGKTCAIGGAAPKASACAAGACVCGSSPACADGQACCSAGPSAACADLSHGTPVPGGIANCGACGNTCLQAANADMSCTAGTCTTTCRAGWTKCGGTDCSVRLDNDPMNCGACGKTCPGPAPVGGPGSAICAGGTCGVVCAAGFLLCPIADGVMCVDPRSDPNACGGCGLTCSGTNVAERVCAGVSGCVPRCAAGYADCSKGQNDGCETRTASDLNNCGACGNVCERGLPGDAALCINGKCLLACPLNRSDCDSTPGCEVNLLTDNNNCGACGKACGPNSTCSQGACVCAPSFMDCDGRPGCEVDYTSDPANCGGCGKNCGARAGNWGVCDSSQCAYPAGN